MDTRAFLVLCFVAAIWAFFHNRSSKKKSIAYALELELTLRERVRGMQYMGQLEDAAYHSEIADAILMANAAVLSKQAIPQDKFNIIHQGLARATDPYLIDRFITNIDGRQGKCRKGLTYLWEECEKLSKAK